jgi:hypothetical protein
MAKTVPTSLRIAHWVLQISVFAATTLIRFALQDRPAPQQIVVFCSMALLVGMAVSPIAVVTGEAVVKKLEGTPSPRVSKFAHWCHSLVQRLSRLFSFRLGTFMLTMALTAIAGSAGIGSNERFACVSVEPEVANACLLRSASASSATQASWMTLMYLLLSGGIALWMTMHVAAGLTSPVRMTRFEWSWAPLLVIVFLGFTLLTFAASPNTELVRKTLSIVWFFWALLLVPPWQDSKIRSHSKFIFAQSAMEKD